MDRSMLLQSSVWCSTDCFHQPPRDWKTLVGCQVAEIVGRGICSSAIESWREAIVHLKRKPLESVRLRLSVTEALLHL